MKYLKLILIILVLGIILQIYAYVNLSVSYEYEVDQMRTVVKVSKEMSEMKKAYVLNQINERETDILTQQKWITVSIIVFSLGAVIALFLYYKKDHK